ncbi:copper resistance CopC family protein [Williamsia sterculiae]|uniref:CopC domain-containing protein n=1 Tax=Williamsia sterculiae TaxID=1344003 RepID=A0A1N7H9E6_9NOCA|nr:copper resistance CopC family protein [Williamsia sterculiae]SIS21476.1 hypothetical protein SAMN05445060_3758 [Williamsia sterculiae]
MTRSRITSALLALVAVLGLSTIGTGPASAHSTLVGSDPADNTSLSAGPQRVTLRFNEALQSSYPAMTIVGPDGNQWQDGTPVIAGASASVSVRPLGPTGEYRVNWRVTSADGHPVSGTVRFTLTTAGTGTPGPKAGTTSGSGGGSGGVPVWPFIVGGVVLFAGGLLVTVRPPKFLRSARR